MLTLFKSQLKCISAGFMSRLNIPHAVGSSAQTKEHMFIRGIQHFPDAEINIIPCGIEYGLIVEILKLHRNALFDLLKYNFFRRILCLILRTYNGQSGTGHYTHYNYQNNDPYKSKHKHGIPSFFLRSSAFRSGSGDFFLRFIFH